MEQEVKITNREWNDLSTKVETHEKKIKEHENRLDRHGAKIDTLEANNIALPLTIQEAVQKGMSSAVERLNKHDDKFISIDLAKERERADKLERKVKEDKEKRLFYRRTLASALIVACVSGVVGFYIAAFLNNL
ncbi:hypothetical protein HB837_15875 [Listeria innocua]|uniref:hypothetical protein n=1 Tax=Listeria innocua TaxID=1642 RepID=UPI001629F014|nr:hypothetical protein [Listeria innocua]MBC1353871.1 hypothetical protein [Listeria innocua]MBC1353885.1 hypothetical protein [Listeria innocua]